MKLQLQQDPLNFFDQETLTQLENLNNQVILNSKTEESVIIEVFYLFNLIFTKKKKNETKK